VDRRIFVTTFVSLLQFHGNRTIQVSKVGKLIGSLTCAVLEAVIVAVISYRPYRLRDRKSAPDDSEPAD